MIGRTCRWGLLSIFLVMGSLGPALAAESNATQDVAAKDYELFSLLVDTLDQVERNYVKEIDRRELIEAAIQGLLSKLDDPYSNYIAPEDLGAFKQDVEAQFGGIGIQIGIDDGQLKVMSPLVGTPAHRAGLRAGDRIVQIEGESTEGITIDQAVRRLKGEIGTQVTLTILHAGSREPKEVNITRDVIHVPTVLGDRRAGDGTWDYMLDAEHGIAYVRITAFSHGTPEELYEILDGLTQQGMRGLILDLRFNPGGLLGSAIEVCDLFIDSGRIVSTEGRNSRPRVWDAGPENDFPDVPMVVLVNRYSASASEIVAACLQDHDRAVVMGERTWGKGSVQNVIELEGGKSALKLTTAGYMRPSGKNIHKFPGAKPDDEWGVTPNEGFEIKLSNNELSRLIVARSQRDAGQVEAPEGDQPEQDTSAPPADETSEDAKDGETPADDPSDASTNQETDGAAGSKSEASDDKTKRTNDTAQPPADVVPSEDDAEASPHDEDGQFVDRQLQRAVAYLIERLQADGDAANPGDDGQDSGDDNADSGDDNADSGDDARQSDTDG